MTARGLISTFRAWEWNHES